MFIADAKSSELWYSFVRRRNSYWLVRACCFPVRQNTNIRHDIVLQGIMYRWHATTQPSVSRKWVIAVDMHLNVLAMSRNGYLLFASVLMSASCFLRTILSQITTSFFVYAQQMWGGEINLKLVNTKARNCHVPHPHFRIQHQRTRKVVSYSSWITVWGLWRCRFSVSPPYL